MFSSAREVASPRLRSIWSLAHEPRQRRVLWRQRCAVDLWSNIHGHHHGDWRWHFVCFQERHKTVGLTTRLQATARSRWFATPDITGVPCLSRFVRPQDTHPVRYRRTARRSNSGSYFTTCKWCDERIHMREMPHGQWLAFNADDSVHTHDGPSGFDDTASSGSHGLQPPTPPFIPKPASSRLAALGVRQNQKTRTPPVQKKSMPDWLEMLLGIILLIVVLYLFSLFSKK